MLTLMAMGLDADAGGWTGGLATEHRLRYEQPAVKWTDALPLGNGRIGAMVFGRPDRERIALNEDTLWSGGPRDESNPGASTALPEVRRALFEGRWADVDRLAQGLQGPYSEAYLPVGDLWLETVNPGGDTVTSYVRSLDLDIAEAVASWSQGGVRHERVVWTSHPDQTMTVRWSVDRPGALAFDARLTSPLSHAVSGDGAGQARMVGRAPAYAAPSYLGEADPIRYGGNGLRFAVVLDVRTENGTAIVGPDGTVMVRGADAAVITLGIRTSFRDHRTVPSEDVGRALDTARAEVRAAAAFPWTSRREAHRRDHQELYRRCSLHLEPPIASPRPAPTTDARVARFEQRPTEDPGLAALLYHFGRYLLIASSRPGTQPANLQGIWNESVTPPWSSNYTVNINTEMNYWLAEPTNLSECHEPLLQMVRELTERGRVTAKEYYGARGTVTHHNVDLWRKTSPVGMGSGNPVWANWALAGPWLAQHPWERWRFSGRKEDLDAAWPVLVANAEFALDWLIEDARPDAPKDAQGRRYLLTAPSTSPEVGYLAPDGTRVSTGIGATMDLSLYRELLSRLLEASDARGVPLGASEKDLVARVREALPRLLPLQVGSRGQLQEWADDFLEQEVNHRHLSHLIGAHPGDEITPDRTPEMARAVLRSMEIRGDEATGWAMGWRLCFYARLRQPERAFGMVRRLLAPAETPTGERGGVYKNLFDAHPPFQIDGNFGYTAGVTEMVVQSHQGWVDLLPALPSAWSAGTLRGVRARTGLTVDVTWHNGGLHEAVLSSDRDQTVRVRWLGGPVEATVNGRPLFVSPVPTSAVGGGVGVVEFSVRRSQRVVLTPAN